MYTLNDLTIIIPTLGRQPEILDQVIGRISKSVKTIVVWDGHQAPAQKFWSVIDNYAAKTTVVRHEKNRGLSAARNTGIANTKTALCMFVDDDIVPEQNFEKQVIDFHNKQPGNLQMMLGCVTWRGGQFASPLTEWYETRSNWNLFHTIQANQNFPFFAGGFTSFKKSAMDDIQYDESFTRYGCEDTEFGYRFFRRGGTLSYRPDIVGIHLKQLDFKSYCRDHKGAGYSQGNMLDLHPDVGMDIGYIFRAIKATLLPETLEKLCLIAEELLRQIPNPGEDEQCDHLLRLITNQCLQQGLVDYLSEHYEGFSDARQNALNGCYMGRETLLDGITGYAPFHFMRAEQSTSQEMRLLAIKMAIELSPHYAAPHILAFDNALPDAESARSNLAHYLDTHGECLDKQTESRIRQRLDGCDEGTSILDTLSARDLYFRLSRLEENAPSTAIIELSQAILSRDISHVGARIAWAKAIASHDPNVAKLLLSEASFFLRNRPLHEQKSRSAEIAQLREEQAQ